MGLSTAVITALVCSAAVCRPLSELHEYVTSDGDVSGVAYVSSEHFVSGEGTADTTIAVHWRNMKAVASAFCLYRSWVRVPAHR